MASVEDPQAGASTCPGGIASDAPVDIDFTAILARSQAQLIDMTGKQYQASADMRQKLTDLGLGPKVQAP